MALSFWLAWKVTTRLAVIGISSPVLGLRPGRCGFSRDPDLLEEVLDHVLGFALVEAELLEEQVSEFGFRERHTRSWLRSVAPNLSTKTRSNPATAASISASVKVRAVSCISTRIARLFLPCAMPAPR